MRTAEWKYIHYPCKPYGELYHVTEDPWELHNLYADLPEVREGMLRRLYRLMDETEDFRHPVYGQFSGIDPTTGDTIWHYHTW